MGPHIHSELYSPDFYPGLVRLCGSRSLKWLLKAELFIEGKNRQTKQPDFFILEVKNNNKNRREMELLSLTDLQKGRILWF